MGSGLVSGAWYLQNICPGAVFSMAEDEDSELDILALLCIHSSLVNWKSSMEVDKKLKNDYYQVFVLSNVIFGCVKEASQGDITLTHPKHVLLYRQLLI